MQKSESSIEVDMQSGEDAKGQPSPMLALVRYSVGVTTGLSNSCRSS